MNWKKLTMSADTEQREMPGASNSWGKRSIVWKYFKFQTISGKESKSKTVCEICGKVLNYCSNTTNMMAHLDNLHWGIVHDVTAKKAKLPTEANQTSKAPGKSLINKYACCELSFLSLFVVEVSKKTSNVRRF